MSGMAEFGALVKSARVQRGWTQTELARRIGYDTHDLIVRIERGRLSNPPTPEAMRALERELGISRQTMLETMGYLDAPLEESDTITIRRDDPRANLLARLDDATDDEVNTIAAIINVMVQHGPRRGTEGVLSDGNTKQSDDAGGRTA